MTLVALFCIGLTSWLIATLTAGGAGIIYLVLAGTLLSVPMAAVTLGIAGMLTGAYRVWVYRHDLSWDILPLLLTGTALGADVGSSLFGIAVAAQYLHALQIFLAIFLIVSGGTGLSRCKIHGIKPRLFWFFPMGLCTGFISGLIGAAGVYVGHKILGHIHSAAFNTVLNLAMLLYGLHLIYEVYHAI